MMDVTITYHALCGWKRITRNRGKCGLRQAIRESREIKPQHRHHLRSVERHGTDRRYFLYGSLLIITDRSRSTVITVFRPSGLHSRYEELDGSPIRRKPRRKHRADAQ